MADIGIKAVITGENRARDAVNGFNGDLRESGRIVSEFTNQLVGRFSPGIDNAIRGVSQMTTGLNRLSGGLTGIAGAAIGVAGVIAGTYLDAWQKARESALEYDRAMRSFDFSRIVEQSQKVRKELELVREELDKLTRTQSERQRIIDQSSPSVRAQGGFFGTLGQARQAPLDTKNQLLYGRFIGSQEEAAALQGIDQSQAARLERIKTESAQRGLYDFRASAIEAEYQQARRQAEDLERGVGTLSQDPAAAARLRSAAEERRRFRFAGEVLAPGIQSASQPFESFEAGLLTGPTRQETLAGILRRETEEIEKLRQEIEQALLHPDSGTGLEQVGIGPTLAEGQAGVVRSKQDLIELRQIEATRADILSRQAGLTEAQRAALALQAIEAERVLRFEEARGNVDKEELATLNAQVQSAAVLLQEFERTMAVGGLGKAAREIGDEWTAAGRRAESTFRSVADTVQQTLATVLRGDKLGKDFGRDFVNSLRNIFTDELSKLLIGTAVRGFSSVLGGGSGGGGFFGSALNIVAGGGGGGGGLGDLLNIVGRGASAIGLLPADAVLPSGYNLLGSTQVGGQNFSLVSRSNLNTPTGGVFDYAVQGAYRGLGALGGFGFTGSAALAYGQAYWAALRAGATMAQAAQVGTAAAFEASADSGLVAGAGGTAAGIATDAGLYIGGTLYTPVVESGVYTASSASSSSLFGSLGEAGSFGSYAAIAARAFQDTRWFASNRGYSGEEQLLYGLHGAGMGLADFWTGGLAELGPLLGGFIGGDFGRFLQYGLFSFVKPHIPRRVREAISVRDVLVPFSNEFITRINGATTPEELFAILVSGGSGYTGGTTRLAIRTWVNGKIIGSDLGIYPGAGYATVDDLLDSSSSLMVQTDYGVSQHFLDGVNAAVEAAIKAKVAQFNAILGQGTIGYTEPLAGGAVMRSTVEPLGSDISRLRGLDLYTQTRKELAAFFNDDNLAASFLRRLAQVDRDLDTGFLNTDDFPV